MSTIAPQRESSVPRRPIPQINTPTSSARPSVDSPQRQYSRSDSVSPNRGPAPRRNREALREYYKLKAAAPSHAISENPAPSPSTQADDASSEYSFFNTSDVAESELDIEGFDSSAYIQTVLSTQSLSELLRTYNGILSDIRALDAEKKALVYDNYSKLIAATETIEKMRRNMDPLNPMASTLDPAISSIYERASGLKEHLRGGLEGVGREEVERGTRRRRAREAVMRVLDTPGRLSELVKEGKEGEARKEWEPVKAVLESWKEQGKGGEDVQKCIDEGEAALKGTPNGQKTSSTTANDK